MAESNKGGRKVNSSQKSGSKKTSSKSPKIKVEIKTGASKGSKRRLKKNLLIELIIAIVLIFASYYLDTEFYIITDFIENNISNPEPARVNGSVNTVGTAEGDLLVHFVDVGQGDCIILQLPDGKNMIIDGGPRKAKNAVLNFINSYNITEFDYLMLTHTDEDHVGSLDDVILNTSVKKIYKPEVSSDVITTTVYRDFLTAVSGEGLSQQNIVTSVLGDRITSEAGYEIIFFTPSTGMYGEVKKGNAEKINAISPIIMLKYGGKKVMFTGDATAASEEFFLSVIATHSELRNEIVDVDVLKVAHHGSDSSTTVEFLSAVKPEISVISVGAGNDYGHPKASVLSRLQSYGSILRTDEKGTITLKLDPDELGNAEISVTYTNNANGTVAFVGVRVNGDENLIYGLFFGRKYLTGYKLTV